MKLKILAVGVAMLMMPAVALGQAKGLPGAPTWKSGKIKRSGETGIVLDEKDKTREIAPEGMREKGLGTGFFINRKGFVLTNNHVIAGCRFIKVQPVTGGQEEGELVLASEDKDLALLKTAFRPKNFARFRAQSDMTRGEVFRVIGYPTRTLTPLKPVLEEVTFLGAGGSKGWLIVKGEIYPGNSGGPAFDQYGRISGVVVAKINTPGVFQETGQMIKDEGYLISLPTTRAFLNNAGAEIETLQQTGDYADAKKLEKSVTKIGCWR